MEVSRGAVPLVLTASRVSSAALEPRAPVVSCSVTVTNTGSRTGDEVVIVFTGPNATNSAEARSSYGLPDSDPLAIKQVVDFARVGPLAPGAFTTLNFDLPLRSFTQVDAAGRLVVYAGSHAVRLSRGVGNTDDVVVPILFSLAETAVVRGALELR